MSAALAGTIVAVYAAMSPPYDHAFKSLAERDHEALLRCLGALGPDEPAIISTPPRELRTSTRIPDLLYEVRSGKRRRLVHIEAQTRYHSSLARRVLEYAALAWIQHQIPVVSYVLLLTARDCPASLARLAEMKAGGLRMRYERIKLWELDPDQVLASERSSLWPLVPLMRSDEPTLRRVAQRLGTIADKVVRLELSLRFIVLGSLRYSEHELRQLVEEHMITWDHLKESSGYQMIEREGIEKGIKEGIERGREEGIGQGEIRLLSRLLERRFGPLPSWAVDKMRAASLDTLEGWGLRVMDAPGSKLEEFLA